MNLSSMTIIFTIIEIFKRIFLCEISDEHEVNFAWRLPRGHCGETGAYEAEG